MLQISYTLLPNCQGVHVIEILVFMYGWNGKCYNDNRNGKDYEGGILYFIWKLCDVLLTYSTTMER